MSSDLGDMGDWQHDVSDGSYINDIDWEYKGKWFRHVYTVFFAPGSEGWVATEEFTSSEHSGAKRDTSPGYQTSQEARRACSVNYTTGEWLEPGDPRLQE
jgi:hypothetical protein